MGPVFNFKNGLYKTWQGFIFYKNNKAVYGFKIKPKGISAEQKRIEIEQILKITDEYCKALAITINTSQAIEAICKLGKLNTENEKSE